MLQKTLLAALLIVGFVSPAIAQTNEAQNTTISMPKFKFQYRMSAEYSDNGVEKNEITGEKPISTTTFNLDAFRLIMEGDIADDLSYALRLSLEKINADEPIDYAYLKWKMTDRHVLSLGKMKARVFGWEHKSASPLSLFLSHALAAKNTPFRYNDMLAFENNYSWGSVVLQVVQDVVPQCSPLISANSGGCGSWTEVKVGKANFKQPAFIFEYSGIFGAFQPLLQLATYDEGHSTIGTIGMKWEQGALNAELDYTLHTLNIYGLPSGQSGHESFKSKETNIAFNTSYRVEQWKPFLHVSAFGLNEYTPPGQDRTTINSTTGDFDDNATQVSIGTEYFAKGDALRPYAALVQKSGKFYVLNKKETLAENRVLLGVRGEF